MIQESGKIGAIIFDDNDVLIGFETNGLIRLMAEQNYQAEKFNINCGIFSLWKDKQQDIIWIGTDGQGVYAWTKDEYTFTNILLNELPISKKRPIRAVYTDKYNTLWLGTKDNGIIKINHYDTSKSIQMIMSYTLQHKKDLRIMKFLHLHQVMYIQFYGSVQMDLD